MKVKVIVLALIMALMCAVPVSAAMTANQYYRMPDYGYQVFEGVHSFGEFTYAPTSNATQSQIDTFMRGFVAASGGNGEPFFVWANHMLDVDGHYILSLGYKPGATTAALSLVNPTTSPVFRLDNGTNVGWQLATFYVYPDGTITVFQIGNSNFGVKGGGCLLSFGACSIDVGLQGLSASYVDNVSVISMYDDGQYFGTLDDGGGGDEPPPFDPVFPVVPEGDTEFVPYDTAVWTDRFVPWVKQSIGSSTNIGLLIFAVIMAIIIVPRVVKKFAKSS